MFIYHIIQKAEWERAKEQGSLAPESLRTDGFIHCSLKNQVCKVADYHFTNERDLLLLEINVSKVKPKILFEDLYNLNEDYPHIYGKLNMNAIKKVYHFYKVNDAFVIPKEKDII